MIDKREIPPKNKIDIINNRISDLSETIEGIRFKTQLVNSKLIQLFHEINLKPSHNYDFIQFLEDLEVPHAPSNSSNKTEFHNGAVIMKDIILKKLKSLSRG